MSHAQRKRLNILTMCAAMMMCAAPRILTAQNAPSYSGEELLNDRCTKCHDLKRVERKYGEYDRGKWEKLVDSMIKRGAQLNAAERGAVIEHLTVQAVKK